MCTVSWSCSSEGYDLFCNRDEKLTRPKAEEPRIRVHGGVQCIAPLDPMGGGTWIGVNEFGVSACLLNLHVSSRAGVLSRGFVVRQALHHETALAALKATLRRDLRKYAPFTLLLFEPNHSPAIVVWNGTRRSWLAEAKHLHHLTSSSLDQDRAASLRRAALPLHRTPDALRGYHRSHSPQQGPYSVCMHREDAETVSFSHIRVSPQRVDFHYQAGPPCVSNCALSVSLRRLATHPASALHAAC